MLWGEFDVGVFVVVLDGVANNCFCYNGFGKRKILKKEYKK